MRNIKLVLEYDGTDFCGWQVQPDKRTVQGVLQDATRDLFQESVKIIGAGRTDAGVHALAQVANFETSSVLTLNAINQGLNTYLPSDVRVVKAEEVADKFHSRFDAVRRTYRYVISKRPRAIERQYGWFCKYKLKVTRLKEASEFLLGSHVFEAFSKISEDENHYLCDVESASWRETEENLIFAITANRFLHKMVRIIVGTLVDVGRGKLSPADVREILDSGDRKRAGFAAPPQGLFLVSVDY
ncbi:MAG: tRNA pseudouridine(38-40) synthase TruA [bacterium]